MDIFYNFFIFNNKKYESIKMLYGLLLHNFQYLIKCEDKKKISCIMSWVNFRSGYYTIILIVLNYICENINLFQTVIDWCM